VFQGGALFDSMSVLDNVGYALTEHTKMSDAEIRDRAEECLEMVGLGLGENPDILEKFPANLSGGMRKRVALARSIAIKPAVILYDEPTTGLDPPNCDRISMMIRHLQEQLSVTSIVVTHDIDTAFHVSDRMAMLHDHRFPWVARTEDFRKIQDEVVRDFIVRRTR
ncbi:MAG: ABC transporter ATP-binding protein, partial [Nannocystaceae bacterium]